MVFILQLLQNECKRVRAVFRGQEIAQARYTVWREITLEVDIKPAKHPYVLFVSLFSPNISRKFVVRVYSRAPLLNTVLDASTGERRLKELPPGHPTN